MSDQKVEYTPPHQPPPGDGETRPLPEGWLRQFDPNSNAWFYVDTLASPPRSIWVHPYDDPQYLESHPHVRDYYDSPPEYHGSPSPPPVPTATRPDHEKGKDKHKDKHKNKGKAPEKRGLLGKLKDKAIGTKEEREAARRLREEERQERLALQRAHAARYGAPPQMYPEQYQQYPGGPYQQGYGQPVYAQPQSSRRGFGGGGMALPLIGGLAGGLLLGEMLGGDGGDFGGGDFGGGDFGGGF